MPPTDPEVAALVTEWLTFDAMLPLGGERHYAADTRLSVMSVFDPLGAWGVLLAIAASTTEPRLLRQLGAGRLEDLLAADPQRFIPLVICEASENPSLRTAVLGVWLCGHRVSEELLFQLEASVPGFLRLAECGCPAEGA